MSEQEEEEVGKRALSRAFGFAAWTVLGIVALGAITLLSAFVATVKDDHDRLVKYEERLDHVHEDLGTMRAFRDDYLHTGSPTLNARIVELDKRISRLEQRNDSNGAKP